MRYIMDSILFYYLQMEQPKAETSKPNTQSIRLPSTLKPLHYLIKLQPFVNGNSSVVGYVEVEMEVLESTSNITLHMADILTKNDSVKVLYLMAERIRE